MSVSYRVIAVHELDAGLVAAWRSIQAGEPRFASPYFCPEFTQAVAAVRDDVRIVVIENGGRPAGFFPHQRSYFGRGRPVGGPLSDYHGVIAAPQADWSVIGLMRAARLAVWTFDHLVDPPGRFTPYANRPAASPHIDLARLAPPPQFARKARKLSREAGELGFTLHNADAAHLERLVEWKREQYRRTGVVDAFGVPWTRRLVRAVMRVQNAEFAGVCSVLRAGDAVVALHAGMRSRATFHWWFPVYDPAFARYSPGIILLLRIAAAMAEAGVRTLDLGKGEERYKRTLMTGAAALQEGFVERPSIFAAARRWRRGAEALAAGGGLAAGLRLPLRAIGRLERTLRFR